jgi:Ca-activated chloride channel family protein
MSFAHPLFLLALLAVPVFGAAAVIARRRRMRYTVKFTNLAVLAPLVPTRTAWRRHVPAALLLLSAAVLAVGVAKPRLTRSIPVERATVILVVDASGSMQADDVKPTRVVAAERAVGGFLDRVPKRLRVGLVVFASDAQVAAPPTGDRERVRQTLNSALRDYPGYGGTAIGDALAAAVRLGREAIDPRSRSLASAVSAAGPRGKPLVSILFLSDGAQTSGRLPPFVGAQQAKRAGFPVYTIALGTPKGALSVGSGSLERTIPVPPDPVTLRQIAQATGGRFFAATSAEQLTAAYSQLGSSLGRKSAQTEVTFACMLGGIVLLLGAGVASAAWSPRLP